MSRAIAQVIDVVQSLEEALRVGVRADARQGETVTAELDCSQLASGSSDCGNHSASGHQRAHSNAELPWHSAGITESWNGYG